MSFSGISNFNKRTLLSIWFLQLLLIAFFPTEASAQTILKRVTVSNIVEYLRNTLHVKLSFEIAPVSVSDSISVQKVIDKLEKIPSSEQTSDEKEKLLIFHKLLKQNVITPETPISLNERQYDLTTPISINSDLQSIFQEICTKDNRYTFEKSNSMWVLKGQDPIMDKKTFTLQLSNADPKTATESLVKLLKDNGIGCDIDELSRIIEIASHDNRVNAKINLNLKDVSLTELLGRFCEATSGSFIWEIDGLLEGPRSVSIFDMGSKMVSPPVK